MKSSFAKFTDTTIGSIIVFAAVFAVCRYYVPTRFAALAAMPIAAAFAFLCGITNRRKTAAEQLSDGAQNMFFSFMFMPQNAAARYLSIGLKCKGCECKLIANGVYTQNTAAYCVFDAPLTDADAAKLIAKAKHHGKNEVVIFCREQPKTTLDIADVSLKTPNGENVYKLFASLDALPPQKYTKTKKSASQIAMRALDKDKILKYAALSASFFFLSYLTDYSIGFLVAAILSAVLLFVSASVAVAAKLKPRFQS